MKRKLTSRKFWVAIATIVSGVLMMFGFADTSIEVIAGAVVSLGGAIGYMVAEGIVDSKNIVSTVESTTNIVNTVKSEIDKKEAAKEAV